MTGRAVAVSFRCCETRRRERRERHQERLLVTRPARVAKWLAFAHVIDERVRSGELRDHADAARALGFTRARISQIMSLLLLAPDIQEEVLSLRHPAGREPLCERDLRRVFRHLVWEDQRREWGRVREKLGV